MLSEKKINQKEKHSEDNALYIMYNQHPSHYPLSLRGFDWCATNHVYYSQSLTTLTTTHYSIQSSIHPSKASSANQSKKQIKRENKMVYMKKKSSNRRGGRTPCAGWGSGTTGTPSSLACHGGHCISRRPPGARKGGRRPTSPRSGTWRTPGHAVCRQNRNPGVPLLYWPKFERCRSFSLQKGATRWFCCLLPTWEGHQPSTSPRIPSAAKSAAREHVSGSCIFAYRSPLWDAGSSLPTSVMSQSDPSLSSLSLHGQLPQSFQPLLASTLPGSIEDHRKTKDIQV